MKKKIFQRAAAFLACATVLMGSLILPSFATDDVPDYNWNNFFDMSKFQTDEPSNYYPIAVDQDGNEVEFEYDADCNMIYFPNVDIRPAGAEYDSELDTWLDQPEKYIEFPNITLKDIMPKVSTTEEYGINYISDQYGVFIGWEQATTRSFTTEELNQSLKIKSDYDAISGSLSIEKIYVAQNVIPDEDFIWNYYQPYDANKFVDPNAYQNGYQNGQNVGYQNGYQNGQNVGYQNGYADGEASGTAAGYEQGVAHQMEKNNTGIFKNAKFKGKVYYNLNDGKGQQLKEFLFEPNLIQNGVYFETLYDVITNWSETEFQDAIYIFDYTDYVKIEINWEEGFEFDYLSNPIYIIGDSDVSSGTVNNINNKTYTINADPTAGDKRKFTTAVELNTLVINRFTLQVGRPGDLLCSFTLYCENERYNVGYNDGYTAGYDVGEDEGYIKGQRNGFLSGKEEGLKLNENSSWRSLMTAVVEAPINTFRSLFNFEILGLDMRAAFGSILAVCIILIIIKKVLL